MREFKRAVEREILPEPEEGAITFPFPETVGEDAEMIQVTVHTPSPSQFSLLVAAMDFGSPREAVGAITSLFFGLVDEKSGRALRRRLYDERDPFEVLGPGHDPDEDVALEDCNCMTCILMELVKEWSARPTGSPSGSASSQRKTGRSSTARRRVKASTRSTTSTPSGSAT